MPLAPEYAAMFEQLAEAPPAPPLNEMTPAEGREMYRTMRPLNPDIDVHHVEAHVCRLVGSNIVGEAKV